MKAAQVLEFGPLSVITIGDLPVPSPSSAELLVRVLAAGVGPWDALVREGKSGLHQSLPLILGSELSGIVEAVGEKVAGFKPSDEVYGVTNEMFTGTYVEYAVPSAEMVAAKPTKLTHIEAASSPISRHRMANALRPCLCYRGANRSDPWSGGQRGRLRCPTG
jgi:NADPH:quinone reductase-like Zn-dependent oxidoreductase